MLDPNAPDFVIEENGKPDIDPHFCPDDCGWPTLLTLKHGGLHTAVLVTVGNDGRPVVGVLGSTVAGEQEYLDRVTRYLAAFLPQRWMQHHRSLMLDLGKT